MKIHEKDKVYFLNQFILIKSKEFVGSTDNCMK